MLSTTLLDRYRITGELGSGGCGVVYEAQDLLLDRRVAVKLLRPNAVPQATEDLAQEARMVARLEHPNIVPLFDFHYSDAPLFLVMPVLRGETLHDILRHGPLTQEDTLEIGIQLASALNYSHSHGVMHRDIQTKNVMLERGSGGQPITKLFDFGLAEEPSASRDPQSMNDSQAMKGTPLYMSPEQLAEQPLDERSDIYGLGILLYECVVGQPAFTGDRVVQLAWNILMTPPKAPRDLGVEILPELETLILGCLEKNPKDRPQTARELLDTLRRVRCQATGNSANSDLPGLDTTLGDSTLPGQLGDILLIHGDYRAAQRAYEQARQACCNAQDGAPQREVVYLAKLAQLAMHLGQYAQGLEYCDEGLRLAAPEDLGDISTLEALAGMLCCLEGNLEHSQQWIERGFRTLEPSLGEPDTPLPRILLQRARGNLCSARKEYPNALEAYGEALELADGSEYRWERSICFYNLGETYMHLGEHAKAKEYLAEAFQEKSALGDRWGLAYVHYALAHIDLANCRPEEAQRQINAGLRLAEEIHEPKILTLLRRLRIQARHHWERKKLTKRLERKQRPRYEPLAAKEAINALGLIDKGMGSLDPDRRRWDLELFD